MSLSTRAASVAFGLAGLLSSMAAGAAGIIYSFQPQFPEIIVPASNYSEPVTVRASTDFGTWAPSGLPVRIDVTCGHFEESGVAIGTSMEALTDRNGWVSTGYAYRSPAEPQTCGMTFSEVDGDASLSIPIQAYDPATVVMAPDLSEGIVTEATRVFELRLHFYTASGRPIPNNLVLALPYALHGATAEVVFDGVTDIDGLRYVEGLGNNAVGDYDLIIELQNARRWIIPVHQGTPLPGSRRHFGSM